jgi:hypothetical protein
MYVAFRIHNFPAKLENVINILYYVVVGKRDNYFLLSHYTEKKLQLAW